MWSSSYSAFILSLLSEGVEGDRRGSEPQPRNRGGIWMQIGKPIFIHLLILKEKELKTSFILIFSFVWGFLLLFLPY